MFGGLPRSFFFGDKFLYYVIFVDYFTKYMWFYLLKNEYDVTIVFIAIKSLLEISFNTSIKRVYSMVMVNTRD